MSRPSIRSVLDRRRLLWLLGVGLLVNEAFIVPPASFRLAVFVIGALLAGVPGVELARALWQGGPPPVEPPPPPGTSPQQPSPPGTSLPTSGG